jgi:AraC-like DNA-binding protein
MAILRYGAGRNGFEVVDLDKLLPDLVTLGEHRQPAHWRRSFRKEKHWLAFYVAEGTNRIRLEGGPRVALEPGSIGWLPPETRYSTQYGPESAHRLLWIGFDLGPIENRYPKLRFSDSLNEPCFAHDLRHLEPYFVRLIREAAGVSNFKVSALRLGLDTLVLEVVRAMEDPRNLLSLVSMHPAVSKAFRLLETDFRKNWTINELAREVEFSRSRLGELFGQVSGYSIHRFLNKVRIRHAEALLAGSDLPVANIARDAGFATAQHFSRVFKDLNGQTPMAFRRQRALG